MGKLVSERLLHLRILFEFGEVTGNVEFKTGFAKFVLKSLLENEVSFIRSARARIFFRAVDFPHCEPPLVIELETRFCPFLIVDHFSSVAIPQLAGATQQPSEFDLPTYQLRRGLLLRMEMLKRRVTPASSPDLANFSPSMAAGRKSTNW